MTISPNRNARPLSRAFVDAARQAGLGGSQLYNGQAYQGAWIAELAHKDGRRFSAYDAYLVPAMRRENLEVMTDAHATKVVIDRGRAVGVNVRRGGSVETLTARGVVLSAGAFASPQLLMLSGIGPAGVLAQLGIPMHVDRQEVGENLQDHPTAGIVCRTHSRDTLKSAESPLNLLRYVLFKRGMLASGGVEGFAFTQVRPGPVAAPDLEILFLPFERREEFLEPPREHAFSHRIRRRGPAVPGSAVLAIPRSAGPAGHRLPPAQRSRRHRRVSLVGGHTPLPEDRHHCPARGVQRRRNTPRSIRRIGPGSPRLCE